MKNKSLPVIIIVILLLLIGGGAFMMMGKKSAPNPPGQTTVNNGNQESSIKTSIKDLLASGKAQKCTYTDNLPDSDVQGTTYLTAGKMRTDSESTYEGKTIGYHMIVDGQTSYSWSNNMKTGMKFMMNPENYKSGISGTPYPNQTADISKVIDYKCDPWTVDNSLFSPPSNIIFNDVSTMMQPKNNNTNPSGSNSSGAPQGSFNPCAACENLSGDDKTSCLAALKCS